MNNSLKRRVGFVFRRNRTSRLHDWLQGKGPDEMLYGYPYLDDQRFEKILIEGDAEKTPLSRFFYPFEKAFTKVFKIGFHISLPLDKIKVLRSLDVIISTVDTCGLPIALLKLLRIINVPIIYISQGLSDKIEGKKSRIVTYKIVCSFFKLLLLQCDRIIVLGDGACEHLISVVNVPANRIETIHFGVDNTFWCPGEEKEKLSDFILSVGSDLGRDYQTLCESVGAEKCLIISRLSFNPKKPNIEINSNFSDIELRKKYQTSKFVVTPLHNITQPSGQSATLQAMACGKAVILSNTVGLWSTEKMRHMDNCFLVKPNNIPDMEKAIKYLSNHPEISTRIGNNAWKTVATHFSSQEFAHNIEQIVDQLLNYDRI